MFIEVTISRSRQLSDRLRRTWPSENPEARQLALPLLPSGLRADDRRPSEVGVRLDASYPSRLQPNRQMSEVTMERSISDG